MRFLNRLALISTLCLTVLLPTLRAQEVLDPKPTSYVFFVLKKGSANILQYNKASKAIVHKVCDLPVPKDLEAANPDCKEMKQIPATEYDSILRNQLGLAAIIPARNRLDSIAADLLRLRARLKEDPELAEDLNPKIKELLEDQKSLLEKFEKSITANLKALKLYDRVSLHLGFPLTDKDLPSPLGLRIEPEENLKSYQPLTEFPKKKVTEVLLFPVMAQGLKSDIKVTDQEFIDARSSVVALTPSKLVEGHAQLRILLQDNGKPMGSEFSFYDSENKLLGSTFISPPFLPAVGPKVMVEIEKNHFLIVGQEQDKKGDQSMIEHVSWEGGSWKQRALVLSGIPRIQSIVPTLEKTFLLTAISTQSVWLVEIDESGEKILKSKKIYTVNPEEREKNLGKDRIVDATAIVLSDGQIALSVNLTTEKEEFKYGVFLSRLFYYSADWEKTNASVLSSQNFFQRFWDIIPLPDAKLCLITEKTPKVPLRDIVRSRHEFKPVYKTLEIYDSKARRDNSFEVLGKTYGSYGQFGNVAYNPVSKMIVATVEMTSAYGNNIYVFTEKGSFIGTNSLVRGWNSTDLRAIAATPGSANFVISANTTEQREIWEAQRFGTPKKTYKESLATARWIYKPGSDFSSPDH